ncbi:predicted protein [Lichtheimia corymbifera JMRC:FSU:9682]|uniref:Uncharacterized protein n=1 Tax=Lichtheimia corymbifera JMRC:FSU:9682 TaxID=1263082 RepID=A0A068RSZ5_9FUNG|nr:predicted protein [Lichtheimia corymbifera JMRC:FSU:9682]
MGISIDAPHRRIQESAYCDISWLWAFITTLHPDGLFGSRSAGDDCVIERDHCRELLAFWCLGVYKINFNK